jgi:predicted site-specific integrase-resolvase
MRSCVIVLSVANDLVPTGLAARAIGVDRGTLVRWWQQGLVKPAWVTPGGHARWDVEALKAELRSARWTSEDE